MVFIVGAIIAICQAFIAPTLAKCVPELVDKEDIEGAVAFETSTQSMANFSSICIFLYGVCLGLPGLVINLHLTEQVPVVSELFLNFIL